MSDDPHEGDPIPNELHSEYEGRPFLSCTRCGETLADFEEGFQISKVIRSGECVFEFAICQPCHQNMVGEFSQESRQRMEEFQTENMDHDRGLTACAVCSEERTDESTEYGFAALCHGTEFMQGMMVCGGCNEMMQELISPKTREQRDRFISENFPCAPSDALPEPSNAPAIF